MIDTYGFRRILAGCAVTLIVTCSVAVADKVVVVPLSGAAGNAMPWDVEKGQTFSSTRAGKGAVGTLEVISPLQTYTTPVYGMTFNLIPAGTFTMGSPDGEPGRVSDEKQHVVTLSKSFFMQITEVTQQQWKDVVLAAESENILGVDELDDEPSTSAPLPPSPSFQPLHPVESISWGDISVWIDALNQLTGRNYVFPTEAQWEYAARATTTAAYANAYSFDSSDTGTGEGVNVNLDSMGWYIWHYPAGGYIAGTKPVARKQPNRWGLYDMHGNVWEWCRDWYDAYPDGPVEDPEGPVSDPGRHHVYRGGSYGNKAFEARSARRLFFQMDPDYRSSFVGFRLVLEPEK